ncbi:MAG: rhomboid family intramembrane serine protease [Methylocystis sp.]
MVMPIYDDAPLRYLRWPIVNWTLIALNIVIFLLVQSELFGDPLTVVRGFAIIPRVLFGEAELADWIVGPPPALTLLTALFFHSSLLHLGSNMLFLYVFGDNVEDAMGSFHYVLFYLSCGVCSGVFYIYATPHSITPLIGASGAISGVCAAFLLLHPRATVAGIFPPLSLALAPIWLGAFLSGTRLRSILGLRAPLFSFVASGWLFVGVWILMQLINAFMGEGGAIAWMAHVGGIAAGLVLTPLFKRRKHRLFDRGGPLAPAPGQQDAGEDAP